MNDLENLKLFLDAKFESVHIRLDGVQSGMENLQDRTKDLESRQGELNSTVSRLTDTVEIHERRSTTLEAAFEPVRVHHLKVQGAQEYRKQLIETGVNISKAVLRVSSVVVPMVFGWLGYHYKSPILVWLSSLVK